VFAGGVTAIVYCLGIYTPSRLDASAFAAMTQNSLASANTTIAAVQKASIPRPAGRPAGAARGGAGRGCARAGCRV
jgi:hypothetical protein